jgi:hypothetical protein
VRKMLETSIKIVDVAAGVGRKKYRAHIRILYHVTGLAVRLFRH